MEKLDLKSKSSQAKCIGTIVSILGAFTVTFYKGLPIIFGSPSSISVLHEEAVQIQSPVPQQNWVIGGFLIASGSFILAILFIVQVHLSHLITPKEKGSAGFGMNCSNSR